MQGEPEEGSEDESLEPANSATAEPGERSWHLQSPKNKSQGSGGAGGAGGRRGGRLKLRLNKEETGRRPLGEARNKHFCSPSGAQARSQGSAERAGSLCVDE